MARPGDPAGRPEETSATASSTRDMERELANGAVAWPGQNRPKVNPEVIKRAIYHKFAVLPADVSVAKPLPEDFFIDFKHRHHRDEAVALEKFPYGSLDIHVRPWRLLTHGDAWDLQFHVRLCLEGIPLHAWNESIAKRVVARSCDIDYVEQPSLDHKDTRALCLSTRFSHNGMRPHAHLAASTSPRFALVKPHLFSRLHSNTRQLQIYSDVCFHPFSFSIPNFLRFHCLDWYYRSTIFLFLFL